MVELYPSVIKFIESALDKGDSVEIKPGPNGMVKILQVKRKIISVEPQNVARKAD